MISKRFLTQVFSAVLGTQSVTLPADARPYWLRGVSFSYSSDATVTNRFPCVQVIDGAGNVIGRFMCGPIVATTVPVCTWAEGITTQSPGIFGQHCALPAKLLIVDGWQVSIFFVGGQVGDTTSVITVRTELLTERTTRPGKNVKHAIPFDSEDEG